MPPSMPSSPAALPPCTRPRPRALAANGAPRPKAGLTAREAEVLELLVQGLHNRRIAEALGISPRTVEVHKARVLDKHGVGSVVELVRRIERAR